MILFVRLSKELKILFPKLTNSNTFKAGRSALLFLFIDGTYNENIAIPTPNKNVAAVVCCCYSVDGRPNVLRYHRLRQTKAEKVIRTMVSKHYNK